MKFDQRGWVLQSIWIIKMRIFQLSENPNFPIARRRPIYLNHRAFIISDLVIGVPCDFPLSMRCHTRFSDIISRPDFPWDVNFRLADSASTGVRNSSPPRSPASTHSHVFSLGPVEENNLLLRWPHSVFKTVAVTVLPCGKFQNHRKSLRRRSLKNCVFIRFSPDLFSRTISFCIPST